MVVVQADQRVGERLRVLGRDQQAVDLVLDQLGDAGDGGGDDRRAGGHRLDEHVRDAVAVGRQQAARHAQRAGAAVLVEQRRRAHRAGQRDRHVALGDLRAQRVAVLVVLADDQRVERRRRAARRSAHASTSTSKPFLATSRPTPRTRRRPLRAWPRPVVREQAREVRGQAVVDEMDAGARRDRLAGGATLASVHVTTNRAASSLRLSQPFGFSSGA